MAKIHDKERYGLLLAPNGKYGMEKESCTYPQALLQTTKLNKEKEIHMDNFS